MLPVEYIAIMVSKLKAIAVAITALIVLAVVVPNVVGGKFPMTQKLIECKRPPLVSLTRECFPGRPFALCLVFVRSRL